jgi:hypothetical protein
MILTKRGRIWTLITGVIAVGVALAMPLLRPATGPRTDQDPMTGPSARFTVEQPLTAAQNRMMYSLYCPSGAPPRTPYGKQICQMFLDGSK